jgi:serine/threonine protein kinase
VEGGSLEAWIAERRLTQLDHILDVAIQFAWGLHTAHDLGLVHQDVKPGNVLMSRDGVAKVADFGLARARAAAGERDTTGGQSVLVSYGGRTEEYCSPEQLAEQPLSRKTDIWSWGVSMLGLFTGEVSWETGIVAGEVLESYVDRAGSSGVGVDGLPLMPVGVVQVLRKCFRQKPEDRWGTMLEIVEALKGVYRECTGREYSRPPLPSRVLLIGRCSATTAGWQVACNGSTRVTGLWRRSKPMGGTRPKSGRYCPRAMAHAGCRRLRIWQTMRRRGAFLSGWWPMGEES